MAYWGVVNLKKNDSVCGVMKLDFFACGGALKDRLGRTGYDEVSGATISGSSSEGVGRSNISDPKKRWSCPLPLLF